MTGMPGNNIRTLGLMTLVTAAAILLIAGCTGRTDRYSVEGVVLRIAAEKGEVTVSHTAIPGYMDAMVMPFSVRDPKLLSGVAAGDRIRFELAVSPTASVIDQLAIISAPRTDAGLLHSPAVPTLVPIGQAFPDFSLVDQHGQPFALSSLKGQVVLVTSVYTRCPLPDYCPLLMSNLAQIKKQFAASLGKDLSLVTITFDPKYDTSEVLAGYGARHAAEGPGWYLLTGTTEQIQHVTELFGIEFYPDEGMIVHTLQTTVIDPAGRMFAALEGKSYSVKQLSDVVRAAQQERPPSP